MPDQLNPYEPDDRIERALSATRAEFLAGLSQPALGSISARVEGVRRRRRLAAATGATALAVLTITGLRLAAPSGEPAPLPYISSRDPIVTVASTDPVQSYRREGIELLTTNRSPLDLPGNAYDAQFTDDQHGYVLLAACEKATCALTLARTTDGGEEWRQYALPTPTAPEAALPTLTTFGVDDLVLSRPSGEAWHSSNAGQTWAAVTGTDTVLTEIPPGARLTLTPAGLRIRLPEGGRTAKLGGTPQQLAVGWASPWPDQSGAWWITGLVGAQPSIAVSRDAGHHWQVTPIEAPAGSTARIAFAGPQVYAVVTGHASVDGLAQAASPVLALERSVDGGKTFSPIHIVPPGLAGDLVPLADERLMTAVDTYPGGWWVGVPGTTGVRLTGAALPQVARISRTSAGYVAFGLWGIDYLGYSPDGSNWRRLGVR